MFACLSSLTASIRSMYLMCYLSYLSYLCFFLLLSPPHATSATSQILTNSGWYVRPGGWQPAHQLCQFTAEVPVCRTGWASSGIFRQLGFAPTQTSTLKRHSRYTVFKCLGRDRDVGPLPAVQCPLSLVRQLCQGTSSIEVPHSKIIQ